MKNLFLYMYYRIVRYYKYWDGWIGWDPEGKGMILLFASISFYILSILVIILSFYEQEPSESMIMTIVGTGAIIGLFFGSKKLYNQLDFLPEEVAKFVKNLKKDFDKTINHIKRNDIPKTNNLLEGFFKITFPKKYKRRFRTEQGVKNYLRHMRIRWYERNVLHEKIKI